MKEFLRQNGIWLVVIALALSVLLAVGSVFATGNTDPISGFMRTVTAPVRNVASWVLNWGEGVSRYVLGYDEMAQELEDLRLQVADLEDALRVAQDAATENERLRELLKLQQKRRDFQFEAARVATRSTSNWNSTLTISKGSSAGIAVGDCVVTQSGQLVGLISSVSGSTAVVSTIVDASLEMGGMMPRTYSAGVLEGDFALMGQGRLKMSYLSDEVQIVAGDEVVTSGLGEVYPSGLVVGHVEAVHLDPSGMSRYAVITPAVKLDELVEVFVIKEFQIVD